MNNLQPIEIFLIILAFSVALSIIGSIAEMAAQRIAYASQSRLFRAIISKLTRGIN